MLELQNITKRYGDRTILADVNLSIRKGEIVSILGPSAAGECQEFCVCEGFPGSSP